jgi:hypothetical protein
MAKRFFMLLYLFLTRSYEHIEVVFIRHHTVAKEVDEDDFFHSRESGGTVVSSALELMRNILRERYANGQWNVYGAQASDGDNWDNDSPVCGRLLGKEILPWCQYFAYVEITAGEPQNLWREYAKLEAAHDNFAMQRIESPADIYPVFRELFKKTTRMSAKRQKRKQPLPAPGEWTFELIEAYHAEIDRVARDYGLDTYPNQIELITSEQMMDAYSSVGMPVNYHHWSFGKSFLQTEKGYRRGQMGLAYEIVINSNPCIAYLMEENTMTMQALVIAHAAYGHNSFFKGNYLFRQWTNADAIVDYLLFARNYLSECEERYGEEEVELLLDSCHALMNLGVDRYKRPRPSSRSTKEKLTPAARARGIPAEPGERPLAHPARPRQMQDADARRRARRFPPEPEENLLYFVEKNAPAARALAARGGAHRAQGRASTSSRSARPRS